MTAGAKTMTEPTRIEALLLPFRRRALADEALRWGLRGITAACAWGILVVVAARIRPLGWARVAWIAGAGGLLLAAAIGWIRRRPSLMTVARTSDARLGLAERLGSALAFAGSPGELAARLEADALARAHAHRPADAFPARRHRPWVLVAGTSALALIGLAFLPNPKNAVLAQQRADRAAVQSIAADIRKQEQAVAAAAGNHPTAAQKALQDALSTTRRKLEAGGSPRQALEDLAALNSKLQSLDDPSAAGKLAGAAGAGAALGASPAGQALGSDLASRNLSAAANQAKALAQALSGLTAEQRRQLAQALQNAAKAAQDRPLAGALSQAAGALSAGDVGGARQDLNQASGAISDLASQQSFEQALGAAQAAVQQALQQADQAAGSGSGSQGQGQGQGGSQGRGGQGGQGGQGQSGVQGQSGGQGEGQGGGSGGNGGGNGSGGTGGAGQGNGGSSGPQSGAGTPTDKLYVPQKGAAPGVQQLPAGPLGPGQSVPRTSYRSVLGSFSQVELNALNATVLPPSERDLVQQYFASLNQEGP